MKISFLKLDEELPTPQHSHPGDGGVDLYTRVDFELKPGERKTIPTGVALAIPEGHAGMVIPRSGLAMKQGLGIVNSPGLIDSGYRGEVQVVLINHGDRDVAMSRGERIAQLVVIPVAAQEWIEVGDLPESPRGEGGFGSTGR